ncbi:MAG: hypothetical protein EBY29_14010, partial [Planctomycetes bacterium]|nr:hypothetical protein [Planctomycetota bacterium]
NEQKSFQTSPWESLSRETNRLHASWNSNRRAVKRTTNADSLRYSFDTGAQPISTASLRTGRIQ